MTNIKSWKLLGRNYTLYAWKNNSNEIQFLIWNHGGQKEVMHYLFTSWNKRIVNHEFYIWWTYLLVEKDKKHSHTKESWENLWPAELPLEKLAKRNSSNRKAVIKEAWIVESWEYGYIHWTILFLMLYMSIYIKYPL